MSAPFQQSFGDDEYDDGDPELKPGYREPVVVTFVYHDGKTWRCRCDIFRDRSVCKHIHRFKPEENIVVSEDYL